MYSYGFTVPFVSAYLLWMRRSALASPAAPVLARRRRLPGRRPGDDDRRACRRDSGGRTDCVSVTLVGVVFVLFGAAYVRTAWAALAYLLLMVPLWDGFTESLHEPFQNRSAAIGLSILQAHRHSRVSRRHLHHAAEPAALKWRAPAAASTISIAVLALGLPLAYVFLRDIWRRVVLLVAAVAVAALSNGLRVALICTLASLRGRVAAAWAVPRAARPVRRGHRLRGAVCRPARARARKRSGRAAGGCSGAAVSRWCTVSARAAIVLTVIFLAVGANVLAREPKPVALTARSTRFPQRLGEWTAVQTPSRRCARRKRRCGRAPTPETRRRYRRNDGTVAELYIAYFASQQQRRKVVSYRRRRPASTARRRSHITGSDGRPFDGQFRRGRIAESGGAVLVRVHERPEINRVLGQGVDVVERHLAGPQQRCGDHARPFTPGTTRSAPRRSRISAVSSATRCGRVRRRAGSQEFSEGAWTSMSVVHDSHRAGVERVSSTLRRGPPCLPPVRLARDQRVVLRAPDGLPRRDRGREIRRHLPDRPGEEPRCSATSPARCRS